MDAILAALEALQNAADQRQSAARTAPPPPAPKPPPPVTSPQAAPIVQPRPEPPRPAGLLQGLFEDGNSLLRAVIAAEVLQPPLALRQAQDRLHGSEFWIQQPNEPSI